MGLVGRYHDASGGFEKARSLRREPAGVDPLWVVVARRSGIDVG